MSELDKEKNNLESHLIMSPARHRSYKLWYKVRVINYRANNSINQTALKFGIDRKLVREWCKNRSVIFSQQAKATRSRCVFHADGKHVELEDTLYTWITEKRAQGMLVNSSSVQLKALELSTDRQFKASNGWLARFLRRRRLTTRRITTSGRLLPTNTRDTINQFWNECRKFRTNAFDGGTLINMDETSIYLDDSST